MLILRRRVGEKIVIGDGITVVVSRVSGGRVTLGIEAPTDVHIVRGELRPFDDPPAKRPAAAPMVAVPVMAAPTSPLPQLPTIPDQPRLPR